MGVPALFSHIVKKYGGVIKTIDQQQTKSQQTHSKQQKGRYNKHHALPNISTSDVDNSKKTTFDNLYLDSNSIVYDSVHALNKAHLTLDAKSPTDEDIIKAVCIQIHNYIKQVAPTETLYIAFDGVAPVAKLENQRNRRYKSEFTAAILAKEREKLSDVNVSKDISTPQHKTWDTIAITPGTPFMDKLDKGLKAYFSCSTQAVYMRKFGVKHIMISTSVEAGEGEHKIFEYIRTNPEKHANERTVVYGLDADLIMLSINHLRFCPQLFLFRETPQFVRSLNKNLDPGQLYTLDICELFVRLSQEMNDGCRAVTAEEKNRAFDYIFMMSLLGNDYIPHTPALNIRTRGVAIIMNKYQQLISANEKANAKAKSHINTTTYNLTNGNKINWEVFRAYVDLLASCEEDNMREEHKHRDMLEKKPFMLRENGEDETIQRMNAIPIYNREKEKYINPYEPYWEERYYRALFGGERADIAPQVCRAYLEALEWTMRYYTSGCVDWRWSYPYHYAPLFVDLADYISHNLIYANSVITLVAEQEPNPVHPLTQLSYVLPMSAHHMLPEKLRTELYNKMCDKYSDNWEFEWAYCRYFWECHANMAMFDIDYLEKIVCETNKLIQS